MGHAHPTPDPTPSTDPSDTAPGDFTVAGEQVDRSSDAPDHGAAPGHGTDASLPAETRGERFSRKARRVRLYLYSFITVVVLAYVVAFAVSNTARVRVDWVFGSGALPLIWLVLIAAVLGWLLGILISAVFRWRTRAPRAPRPR